MTLNQQQVEYSLCLSSILSFEDTYQKTLFLINQKSTEDHLYTVTSVTPTTLSEFGNKSRTPTPRTEIVGKMKSKEHELSEYINSQERKHSSQLIDIVTCTNDLSLLIFS